MSGRVLGWIPGLIVLAASAPQIARQVPPEYPAWALGTGLSTTVALRVRVGTDGRASAVQVVPYTVRGDLLTRSLRASFDSAAVRAVRRWTFRPASRDGRPVAAWLAVEVPFAEPGSEPGGAPGETPDSIRSPRVWRALIGEWWWARTSRTPDHGTVAGRTKAIRFDRDGRFLDLDWREGERSGRFEVTSGGGPGESARLTRRWSWKGAPRAVDLIRFSGRDTLVLCRWPGEEPCDTFIAVARGERP